MTRHLYALSLVAQRGAVMSSRAGVTPAVSDDEAVGIGVRLCREAFPPDQGWVNHQAAAGRVPPEMVAAAAKDQMEGAGAVVFDAEAN
jgi:hypothetical protein